MNTSEITLSSGVVLVVKQVPPMVLARIYDTLPPAPKPPIYHNKDLDRDEENLSDPDYLDAQNHYQIALSDKVSDSIIMLGTQLKFVPENFPRPDEDYDSWSEPLIAIGINVPPQDKKLLTYGAWVKYVAACSQEDINNLIESVSQISGVSEKDVAKAAEQFRGDEERPSDS